MRYLLVILCCGVWLAACSPAVDTSSGEAVAQRSEPIAKEAVPTVDPANETLARGQGNYNTYCAHCHGYGGEGQHPATIERTRDLGYHLVPAHDASGHTWQHPDQLLFESIKYGIQSPLNLYKMSAFGSELSDEEIFEVVDYMKTFWTDEQRRQQAQLTDEYAERDPDWSPESIDEMRQAETN